MSEVQQLRTRVELEYQAAKLALEGPAIVAAHAIINKRLENLANAHQKLKKLIGEKEAIMFLCDVFQGPTQSEPRS